MVPSKDVCPVEETRMIEPLNPWSIASINARARPRPCKYCGQDLDRDHDNGCGEIALPINLRKRKTAPDAPAKRFDDGTRDRKLETP